MKSPYSPYLIPFKQIAEPQVGSIESFIKTENANYSKQVGFKRLGIHHVTLPPGHRTSLPHAESLEEEFAYVISGTPQVWIDGFLYDLKAGCAVGFPAGTGIAHTFLNNSEKNVELLILGERTKSANRCSFPLNPEEKETCGIWWGEAPGRPLGPHNGKPGPVQPQDKGEKWPSFIVDCLSLERDKDFHYPADSETFGEYLRLTDPLELKALGIGYEVLRPGHRSAYPHAHNKQEEFVFMLSGTAKVWMNGFIHEAPPGTGVAFLPGTNIAHCLINDTSDPLVYFVVGETKNEALEDRCFYPLHPFRNEQCRRTNYLWEDPPSPVNLLRGSHSGLPQKGPKNHLLLRPRSPLPVENGDPSLEALIIEYAGNSIGLVDLQKNSSEPGIFYLNHFLIHENFSGKGFGRKAYDLLEHYAKTNLGAKILRLKVSEAHEVKGFWQKMGFGPEGEKVVQSL